MCIEKMKGGSLFWRLDFEKITNQKFGYADGKWELGNCIENYL